MKKPTTTLMDERIPKTFSLCIHAQCPMADRCLRRVAWDALVESEECVTIISPLRALQGEGCRYFRSAQRVTYARGFRGMQSQMLPAQYMAFSQRLISHFSRNSYYERRRGDRLCSPADIAFIREVLASIGLFHLEFDAYEVHCNFVD
jgi:hypothetical protein